MLKSNPYFKNYIDYFATLKGSWEDYIGIQYIFKYILHVLKFIFPGFWISVFAPNYRIKNILTEFYLILKVLILVAMLWLHSNWIWTLVVTIYFLCDIVHHLFTRIYNNIWSLKKNFAHLMLNVCEIVLGYAVLYDHLWVIGVGWIPSHNPLDVLYFSMVTFATVGYGDMGAINVLWRMLVASQIAISLLFIVIICSSFVAQMGTKKEL